MKDREIQVNLVDNGLTPAYDKTPAGGDVNQERIFLLPSSAKKKHQGATVPRYSLRFMK
jgi:hypothetical protein